MASTSRSGASAGGQSSPSKNDASQSTTTLQISTLPPNYTSESLSALLSAVGPIRVAFIVTEGQQGRAAGDDANSGAAARSKGYGFAKFVLKEDAEKAIADLDGTIIDGRKIGVKWAKRRQRKGIAEEQPSAASASFADESIADNQDYVSLNVKNAYAARREAKRAVREGGDVASVAVDNARDSRTVVISGGLDANKPEEKKALQKKLKKLAFGINTGSGALQASSLNITPSSETIRVSNNENGETQIIEHPLVLIECPNSKISHELVRKLNDTVTKGHLVLAKNKFESDLISRKGHSQTGAGRLIVRNLAFDVTYGDLASVFASYGPIQAINLHHGYAFVTYTQRADAEKALAGANGKRIYSGMLGDRIEEAAKHELTSVKRKKAKGKIVGVKGRVCAVDWALEKKEYMKLEMGDGQPQADGMDVEQMQNPEDHDSDDSDMDPIALQDGEEDSDMSPEPEDDDGDDLDEAELAPPSDVEEDAEEDDEQQSLGQTGQGEEQGSTLFVRNIQFEATEDELYNLFKAFGPVRYARIVMDPQTKRSRGTGFVNFYKDEDAVQCLQEADRLEAQTGAQRSSSDKLRGKNASSTGLNSAHHSLLTADPSAASASRLTLHGRVLGVSPAVSKGQADRLREERDRSGKSKDRRNLYLMHEGVILPDSPLADALPASDVQTRQSSFEARRNLLRTNPALYISRTRLAIRQIPLFVTEGMLKRLAGWAIKAFESDVKRGRRSKLTLDELREPVDVLGGSGSSSQKGKDAQIEVAVEHGEGDAAAAATAANGASSKSKKSKRDSKVKQAKILRQDDRIDPLSGLKRSKGYGFLELHTHADALRVIRLANANNDVHKLFHTWWKEDLKLQIDRLEGGNSTAAAEGKEEGEEGLAKKQGAKDKMTTKKQLPPMGKSKVKEGEQEQELRLKRMKEKLEELESEDPGKVAGRQGKSLIIEFSIENAVTVKRRNDKTERVREVTKKRKRAEEAEREEEYAELEAVHGAGSDDEQPARGSVRKSKAASTAAKKSRKDASTGKASSTAAAEQASRNSLGSMIGKKRKIAKMRKGGK